MKTQPHKNLWDAIKAVFRGKFLAIQSFLKKEKKISNQQPNLPPKRIRKTKTKLSRKEKKIIKISKEINRV